MSSCVGVSDKHRHLIEAMSEKSDFFLLVGNCVLGRIWMSVTLQYYIEAVSERVVSETFSVIQNCVSACVRVCDTQRHSVEPMSGTLTQHQCDVILSRMV